MSLVIEFKPRERDELSNTGEAFCLQCGHEWVSVAPVGNLEQECPSCHTMKGLFRYLCMPPPDTEIRVCVCGNDLFVLTRDGHMCPNCGIYQRYE